MSGVRPSFHAATVDPNALAGGVAANGTLRFTVVLNQHGVVNRATERALNRFQICLVAVAS